MIIDNNLKEIRYGAEKESLSPNNRNDIIYKIYLGDRQIWERPDEEIESNRSYKNNTVMTWRINKVNGQFIFGNCTEVTTIKGKIDWGDDSLKTQWRSGNGGYEHRFPSIGEYNIVLRMAETTDKNGVTKILDTDFFKRGSIARIVDFSLPDDNNNNKNELIGLRMGNLPFAEERLYSEPTGLDEHYLGVLEGYKTLKKLRFCKNVNIKIPQRFCYGTGITNVTIPENVESIGNNAIVYDGSAEEAIIVVKGNTVIGENSLGYKIGNNGILRLFNKLRFYCKEGTYAENYISNKGLNFTAVDDYKVYSNY